MTVQCRQASPSAWVPKFDLMILGAGNNQSLGRVPVTGFDIPVMSGQGGVGCSCSEVEDLECRIVGRG